MPKRIENEDMEYQQEIVCDSAFSYGRKLKTTKKQGYGR